MWVAEVGGAVAGFLVAEVLDGCAHVEEVSVRPEAEGRGLGSALLEAAADWARTEGLDGVTLTTFRDVPWNAPFYERRGLPGPGRGRAHRRARGPARREAAAGLDPDLRVVMRRDL